MVADSMVMPVFIRSLMPDIFKSASGAVAASILVYYFMDVKYSHVYCPSETESIPSLGLVCPLRILSGFRKYSVEGAFMQAFLCATSIPPAAGRSGRPFREPPAGRPYRRRASGPWPD